MSPQRAGGEGGAPAIDIMIPFYRSAHIREAVESVIGQTSARWRLVIVDDASPDRDSVEWLRTIDHPQILYSRNDENLGVAGNFSRCLSLVSAPWFVMLGDDDILMPDYVDVMLKAVSSSPPADVVQPAVVVIDEVGERCLPLPDLVKRTIRPRLHGGTARLRGSSMARSLARGDWAYFPSLMWRTESARRLGFRQSYAWALDLAMLFDIALAGGAILVIDKEVFRYRRHRESASRQAASHGRRFAQEAQLLDEYAARFRQAGWRRAAWVARLRPIPRLSALSYAIAEWIRGDFRGGVDCLGWALRVRRTRPAVRA